MSNMDPLPSFQSLKTQFDSAKRQAERSSILKRAQEQRANRFKVSHGFLVAFLFWIICMHMIGIYLFSSGFLLTRLVLDTKSTCDASPVQDDSSWGAGSPDRGCWHPKKFNKAVIIVIDALRYDFAVPFISRSLDESKKHYHDEFRVLHELALKDPEKALLLPFIADPPTTTLQRLKGLTTGTLPTFIDAGSNFAGTSIDEDNLVAQLNAAGKRVVHLGDDTWQALFPGAFDRSLSHPYDSLNVWDLHTVDNGVSEHLMPLLQSENASRWDVIIGHYLGVDHAGHRYGPDHPAMSAKLRQMDRVIDEITQQIDSETLLVIMGDHGMDVKGDHGGESDDELQSTLFMYSSQKSFSYMQPEHRKPPLHAKERPVGQIDLVPTLSLLLGIPIPYGNLGFPIQEAFLDASGSGQDLAHAASVSAAQIKRYRKAYGARQLAKSDSAADGSTMQAAYPELSPSASFAEIHQRFQEYQADVLADCRSLWAEFDLVSMAQGLAVLVAAVCMLLLLISTKGADIMERVPKTVISCYAGSAIGVICSYVLSHVPYLQTALSSSWPALGFATGGLIGFISSPFITRASQLPSWVSRSPWSWFAITLTLAHGVMFASNSYTIWEDTILLYLISSFSLASFLNSFRCAEKADRILGIYESIQFLVLGRIANYSVLCREEQIPLCKSTYYGSLTSSTVAPWHLGLLLVVALAVPAVIKSYYQSTSSFEGPASVWMGLGLRLGLALNALFWTIDVADDGDWFPELQADLLKSVRINIAQIVLGMGLIVGVTAFAWSSPCIDVSTPAGEGPSDEAVAKTEQIPVMNGKSHSKASKNIPKPPPAAANGTASPSPAKTKPSSITILGYTNVHGSRYFLLLISALLPLSLLQKPVGSTALHLFALQILSLLSIVSISGSLRRSHLPAVMLGLMGNWYFFKTGHQATLASLQWDAAFIPARTVVYPWSPMIMIANTYGAQILSAIAVPLIVLWKRDVKKEGVLGDLARAVGAFMAYHATIQLATTVCAWWLRRHLMLYRVFMPRFLMASAGLVVTNVLVVLVAVGAVRWNSLSVGEIFGVF